MRTLPCIARHPRRRPLHRALALLVLVSGWAWAEEWVPEREVDTVRANYNAANYADTLKRAQEVLDGAKLTDEQRIELLKYAGLAAFTLGDRVNSEKLFLRLLQLNPDYVLDPFAVAPSVIKHFDEIRKKNSDGLSLIRKQLAMKEAEAKREAELKEAEAKRKAEEERHRLEAMAPKVIERSIEKRSFIMNFLPFGVGQFQQKRTGWGVTFATAEGALAVTSVVAFVAIERMFESYSIELENVLTQTGKFTAKGRGIPVSRQAEAKAWNIVKWSTGIAFYVVWIAGVIDALLNHQDEVVSVTEKKAGLVTLLEGEGNPANPGGVGVGREPARAPKLMLFPTTGGFGAGLTVDF